MLRLKLNHASNGTQDRQPDHWIHAILTRIPRTEGTLITAQVKINTDFSYVIDFLQPKILSALDKLHGK